MYKHVLETLTEYKDYKAIKSLVNRKRLNEADEADEKKDKAKDKDKDKPKNPSKKSAPVDKAAREEAIDIKTTMGLLNQNWKSFEIAAKGDMAAYKSMWASFAQIKERLAARGVHVVDAYRFFGSLQKGKEGGVKYQPGDFSIITTKSAGSSLIIINNNKANFDGKKVILTIPGEEGIRQFAEFMKNIKISAKSAKENYVSTTLRKKKDEIFSAMAKGSGKKPANAGDKKVEESGEGDEKKSGKKGNPNFKKGEKPNFEKKTQPEKGKKGVNPFPKSGIED